MKDRTQELRSVSLYISTISALLPWSSPPPISSNHHRSRALADGLAWIADRKGCKSAQ